MSILIVLDSDISTTVDVFSELKANTLVMVPSMYVEELPSNMISWR